MSAAWPATAAVRNSASALDQFRDDVLRGLGAREKELPSKYLYDETGARLFDQICELPEYYPTRTELGILRRHAAEMGRLLGDRCLLVEYGSGSGLKTRLLLDHLSVPAAYVPIDIAREQLFETAEALRQARPEIGIYPVHADFTRPIEIPPVDLTPRRRVVYFPGSTIGNFTPDRARRLLERSAALCGPGGGMLLGTDLKKDPCVIEAAYNDQQGVTAAFNLNLLTRINRELQADFEPAQFWHHALYNPRQGRIEMHLVSQRDQRAHVAGHEFSFAEGESICTEYSYKYSLGDFRRLAEAAGFAVERTWLDERRYFSVLYLTVRRTA